MPVQPSATLNAVPNSVVRAACLLAAMVGATLLPPGDLSAQTPLSAGRTLSGAISEGDTVRYTFEAGEDYFMLGEVDQLSADVDVRVESSDGEPVAISSGPGRGPERFAARPPAARRGGS